MKTVEVLLNRYEGQIEHPELEIKDLGVKSIHVPAKGGGTKRLYGRHLTITGPETIVRSFLDKLSQEHDLHTDL